MITRNQTKIKTVLPLALVLCVFAALGGSLQAGILVYEPFDYAGGTVVHGLTVNAAGLTGTWNASYTDDRCKIKGGSLTYSTLPTAGNHWGPGAVWTSPWIEATLDPAVMSGNLDDGDELWFSYVGNPYLQGGTMNNQHRLQIGADVDNNVAIYENKTAVDQGQVRASITIGGIETVSTGSVTFTDQPRLFVGRVIFGATDTVEVYLPGPDLTKPENPAGTVTGSLDQSTFDMLRSQVTNGNSGVDADEIRIGTTYASVIGAGPLDPNDPEVNAGVHMITLSGMGVVLAPDVVNYDTEIPQRDLTYTWTTDAPGGYTVAWDPSNTVEAPTVTITPDTPGNPQPVTLTLSVNLEGRPPEKAVKDTMKINVYDDSCLAAKAAGTVRDPTDIDENCTTDLRDYAVLAAKWLVDYSLTEPVAQ